MYYIPAGIIVVILIIIVVVRSKKNNAVEETEVKEKKTHFPDPRVHTRMDVPMIRSRIEKLNATEGLEAHARKKLDRMILSVCDSPEPIFWWEPLRRFSQLPNASKGAKFLFLNANSTEGIRLNENILNLSEMIRFCGLRLNGIETQSGDKIPATRLDDDAYHVLGAWGDSRFPIELKISNDQLDVPSFVMTLNQTLSKRKANQRLVLFKPDGPVFCILCTGVAEYKISKRFI